jgi:hypothetical protein
MKKIVYSIVSEGIDGRGKRTYVTSSFDEDKIVKAHEAHKNKAYNRVHEEIVDIDKARREALNKLNSLDKMLLGLDH